MTHLLILEAQSVLASVNSIKLGEIVMFKPRFPPFKDMIALLMVNYSESGVYNFLAELKSTELFASFLHMTNSGKPRFLWSHFYG